LDWITGIWVFGFKLVLTTNFRINFFWHYFRAFKGRREGVISKRMRILIVLIGEKKGREIMVNGVLITGKRLAIKPGLGKEVKRGIIGGFPRVYYIPG